MRYFMLFVISILLNTMAYPVNASAPDCEVDVIIVESPPVYETYSYLEPLEVVTISEPEYQLTEEEIYLIAVITVNEAEGECEEGQRWVIDTILNRVDSPEFPNTVSEVIYQPSQFCASGSRMDKVLSDERTIDMIYNEIMPLVREELISRTNSEVVYFNSIDYSYGTPIKQIGGHYFSKS